MKPHSTRYNDTFDVRTGPRQTALISLFSQLPTELLLEIIRSVLPLIDLMSNHSEGLLRTYMQTLYTLRLVGKRWQEVIDGTPTFWAFVLSTLPPQVNDMSIRLSKDGPLSVVYAPSWVAFGNEKHPSPEDFLMTVEHTSSRWFAYRGPIVRGDMEKQAPLLQQISLRGPLGEETHTGSIDLLGGQTTKLRCVDLSEVSVRWRLGLFTQLKILKLRHIGHDGLTITHLLDYLQTSPQLEHLMLEFIEAITNTERSSSLITLPHLQSIILYGYENSVIESILGQVRAPSWINVSVSVTWRDEISLARGLDEALEPLKTRLLAVHRRIGQSTLVLDFSGFQWQTSQSGDEDQTFYVRIGCITPVPCIRWLGHLLRNDSGLSIRFGDGTNSSDAVLETIAHMRCVTDVLVGGDVGRADILRILKSFGKPLDTSPSVPSLPCLQRLALTSDGWDVRDVLEMVHSRFNSPSFGTAERPLLSISMWREASWCMIGRPRTIIDYDIISKIRATQGVESAYFIGPKPADGMLAVTWNEASKPVWD